MSELTGSTYIAILHSNKPSKEESSEKRFSIRGSGALFDAAQTVYVLAGAKNQPIQFHHEKDRIKGRTLEPFMMKIVDTHGGAGLSVEYIAPEQVLAMKQAEEYKAGMREDLRVVSALKSGPLSTKEIAKINSRRPIDTQATLNRMTASGIITRIDIGKGYAYSLNRGYQGRLERALQEQAHNAALGAEILSEDPEDFR
jgi:hypothetical protein